MAARISLVVSESNVSTANNTSKVTAKLYYYGNGVSWSNYDEPGSVTIDGSTYSFTASFTKSTSKQLLTTKSKTVTHKSDGSKTVTVSAKFNPQHTSDVKNLSTSTSKKLTTIPRVSDISVNKSSVPADGATTITVTATKKSSSFTDTINVTLGSYSKTVSSGVAFTISKDWINSISGTSATATAKVTTKSGSTTIGSKSTTFTVTVPSSVKPSVKSIATSEAITIVPNAFGNGVHVSSLSRLNVNITSSGIYGSTIKSVKTTFDGVTYTGSSFQTSAISKAGTLSMSTTVTDSRNRTATLSKNIVVYGYSAPAIIDVSCVSNGTNTVVTVSGVVSPVKVGGVNKNTKELTLKYKQSTASSYGSETTLTIPDDGWSFSVSKTFAIDSRTVTYDFLATLSDKISTVTEQGTTGIPVISRLAGGGGVTFGAEATIEGLVVAAGWPIYIDDPELESLYNSVFGGG